MRWDKTSLEYFEENFIYSYDFSKLFLKEFAKWHYY